MCSSQGMPLHWSLGKSSPGKQGVRTFIYNGKELQCTQWKGWKGSQQKQDKRLEKGRITLSGDIIRGFMTPEALAIESDRKRLMMAAERPAGHLHRPCGKHGLWSQAWVSSENCCCHWDLRHLLRTTKPQFFISTMGMNAHSIRLF